LDSIPWVAAAANPIPLLLISLERRKCGR
jgi:hypothetical protein